MPAAVPVLAFGGSRTSLGVVRLFGRRGVPCYLAAAGDDPVVYSRWYRSADTIEETTDPEVLKRYLLSSGFDRAVLLPCSDRWATCIAQLPPDVAERFPASICRPDVLDLFVDKAEFAELLESRRVPHPRTITTVGDGQVPIAENEINTHFLKPRDSNLCAQVFKRKAFFVPDSEQLARQSVRMRDAGCGVILQEYIPGPADSHYFIDGFVDRFGAPAAVFARRRLRIFPPDFGNSTAMVSVGLDETAQAVSDLTRLLGSVGYRGMFSAEFKLDERDGVLKLLEVNTRAWWYVEFAALCGVDVCDLAYRDALDQDVPTIDSYRVGRRYAIPSLEMRALTAALRGKTIGPAEYLFEMGRAIKGGRPLDDPLPAVVSAARLIRKAVKRCAFGKPDAD